MAGSIPDLAELAPKGNRRMGANPHANGGIAAARFAYAGFPRPRGECAFARRRRHGQDTMVLGKFLRDVAKLNQNNFRIFGPDETLSNLLGAVFEVTNRQWDAREVKQR